MKDVTAWRRLRTAISLKFVLAGTVVVLAVLGGVGFLFGSDLISAFDSTREGAVDALGLGVAPVALWVGAVLAVAIWRRDWLRRVNVWAGSLAYLAAMLGVLSYFHPDEGLFSALTTDFDASLGGSAGDGIAGDSAWFGALRVLALVVVGTAIAGPRRSVEGLILLGRTLLVTYAALMVAGGGTYSLLRRMYGANEKPAEDTSSGRHRDSEALRKALAAQQTSRPAEARQPLDGAAGDNAAEEPAHRPQPYLPTFDRIHTEPVVVPRQETPEPSSSGRYNKFWSGSARPAQTSIGDEDHFSKAEEVFESEPEPVVRQGKGSWKLPDSSMVRNEDEGGISEEELNRTSQTIERTLAEYNVEVEIGQIKPGPAVSMYGLIPGWVRRYKQVKEMDEDGRPRLDESGKPIITRVESKTRVKVDSIISREKDLSLALKTPSIRIETPVLGESLVGIEVPNPSLSLVTLGRLMESAEYKKMRSRAKLPIALGKSTGGEPVVVDLAAMPHLLVAGATGSGKSVCINAIVSCLLMEKDPEEMRLLLVDPKRVELTPYNGIPHLLTPVVVETDQVVSLLKGLIREMLNRYRRMEELGVRNIDSYNKQATDKMPYLVVAVDELADLMMSASFDVEQSLCRLAQLGRATGIHLIIATQRPSVDVVTGLIKANFPSRISFGVSSQIDSRTILDSVGAEKLLGRGDMLYLAVDASRPKRVQGVFISDDESQDIVSFWQTTPRGPLPEVSLHPVGDGDELKDDAQNGVEDGSRDELMQKAIDLAQHHKKMSTSLLQRRLRIGYPRAARLMDQLEDEGVVGPGDGSKSRDVIMSQI